MQVQGIIKQITPVETINDKFSKQSVILDLPVTNKDYPKSLAIEFSNASMEKLLNYSEGMNVEIECETTSRDFKGKWYTSCRGWNIQGVGATMPQTQQNEPRFASQGLNDVASKFGLEEDTDDLPF